MAQRQRRDWRDAFAIIAHFWQATLLCERQSRCPLEPVLEGADDYQTQGMSFFVRL
jgi:hypothetical protein